MGKRKYIRPIDCPLPLRSNWPDTDVDQEDDYTIKTNKEARQKKFEIKATYLLYNGNKLYNTYKTKELAEHYKYLFRKEKGARWWIHSHVVSKAAAYEIRQRDKKEWLWQAGIGG